MAVRGWRTCTHVQGRGIGSRSGRMAWSGDKAQGTAASVGRAQHSRPEWQHRVCLCKTRHRAFTAIASSLCSKASMPVRARVIANMAVATACLGFYLAVLANPNPNHNHNRLARNPFFPALFSARPDEKSPNPIHYEGSSDRIHIYTYYHLSPLFFSA